MSWSDLEWLASYGLAVVVEGFLTAEDAALTADAAQRVGHAFDELEDAEPASAEEMIRDARATLVRPPRQNVGSQANKNSASAELS